MVNHFFEAAGGRGTYAVGYSMDKVKPFNEQSNFEIQNNGLRVFHLILCRVKIVMSLIFR